MESDYEITVDASSPTWQEALTHAEDLIRVAIRTSGQRHLRVVNPDADTPVAAPNQELAATLGRILNDWNDTTERGVYLVTALTSLACDGFRVAGDLGPVPAEEWLDRCRRDLH